MIARASRCEHVAARCASRVPSWIASSPSSNTAEHGDRTGGETQSVSGRNVT
jgi:hypothetical protein